MRSSDGLRSADVGSAGLVDRALSTPRKESTVKIKRIIERVRSTWSELDYAQRRLFEIRTGIQLDARPKGPKIARRTDELEALYVNGN
jgi:BMFP domain-containing protein YqiC